ncbi:ribonuclease Z [Oceanispirochaeta crateris]|uniref:Ribonuclease Z n=1 Tax=Oceanispirochaeta crateris TaxID=2518645 RepID=A0A5C1QML7_9SPIO|nr:ribonuclease Z [Oceanispirochaeta crateris]QEN07402.1 ribonuclease Z [Oceanispirochaeta crateris]
MEVFVLGTGGMMPLPGRNLTSVLLRREGDLFLFDCGEGTQVSLRKLNLRWKKITTIFISHTHADHITGLPGILMLSSQVERTEPLTIIGPPKIREYVETSRQVLDMYVNYEIIIKEIEEPEKPGIVYETDDLIIRSVPLNHSKVCVGYVLEEKDRPGVFFPDKAKEAGVPCGPLWSQLQNGQSVQLEDGRTVDSTQVMGQMRKGRKFSFVTDTAFVPSLPKEVEGSDLFICEGMFDLSLSASAREKKHLTSHQAATIAEKAGNIKKMGLIHYSPRYTERELRNLLKEAREVFPDTFLCRDRMKLEIPYEE